MAQSNVTIKARLNVVIVTDESIADDVVAALEGRDGVANVIVVRAMSDLEEDL